jgi:hypothetical protein
VEAVDKEAEFNELLVEQWTQKESPEKVRAEQEQRSLKRGPAPKELSKV